METVKSSIRPTKKQKELLDYIALFIAEHGYSPSYREIMRALNYTSVATVALHVGNLIKRGHLHKRDRSARSLEVVTEAEELPGLKSNEVKAAEEKWLVKKVEYFFEQQEAASSPDQSKIDELYVLIGTLKVLGLDGAAQSFIPRLAAIKAKAR